MRPTASVAHVGLDSSGGTKYAVDRDLVRWRIVDGEAVVIHVETTHYYSLNRTGTFLWSRMLEGPVNHEDLARSLAARFDREPSEVAEDVSCLVEEMLRENLIVALR